MPREEREGDASRSGIRSCAVVGLRSHGRSGRVRARGRRSSRKRATASSIEAFGPRAARPGSCPAPRGPRGSGGAAGRSGGLREDDRARGVGRADRGRSRGSASMATTRQPARLLAAIAAALEVSEPVGRGVLTAISSRRPDATRRALPRLLRYLTYREQPVVLVLDDAHAPPRTRGALHPPGDRRRHAARVAARAGVPARARAARGPPARASKVVELRAPGPRDDAREAAGLLERAGLRLARRVATLLVQRTEGWAAGLYLAALSLREQPRPRRAVARFAGDDRLVADYLRDELLADLPRERLRFLTRTSVLDDALRPAVRCRARPAGLGRDACATSPDPTSCSSRWTERRALPLPRPVRRHAARASCAGCEPGPKPTSTGRRARGTPDAGRPIWRSTTPSRRAT